MKRNKNKYKCLGIIFFSLLGCRGQRLDNFAIFREGAKINLLPNNNFEYYFYVQGGVGSPKVRQLGIRENL
jgi:hypothetical protein